MKGKGVLMFIVEKIKKEKKISILGIKSFFGRLRGLCSMFSSG